MKTFFFLIFIPMVAGFLTAAAGYSVFGEHWGIYLAINIPICTISVLLNAILD